MLQTTPQPTTSFIAARRTFHEPHNNFKIISGNLKIIGKEPDGDSVAFIADNPAHYHDLKRGYLLRPSTVDNAVQLRFQAIDTPELHYGSDFQPLGDTARDYLLKTILKFKNIQYATSTVAGKPAVKVKSSTPQTIKAHIATNALEPHGRPIAYIFIGEKFTDGENIRLTEKEIVKTVNYKMIESGFAYLLAYDSMPEEHLHIFRAAANKARSTHKGVWKIDSTFNFKLADKTSVEGADAQLVFPKIFRRCIDYFRDMANGNFNGELIDWFKYKNEENDKVRISNNIVVTFSSLFHQVNNNLSFQADTNDIIFIER